MRFPHRLALWFCSLAVISCILALLALFGTAAFAAPADDTAFVRIIHASPDIGTADIFVDGTKLLNSFPFGQVTDYVRVPTGPHKVQVALIGKGPGAAVITQTLTVGANVPYTVAALGTRATGFLLQAFVDNNLLAPGKSKVRIYHLAPDAGSVNVTSGNKSAISGLVYPQASDYLTMPAGSYTFDVWASQGKGDLQTPANLKMNTITSIFTVGMFNGTPPIELVTSQVNGIPDWPGTGSDPHAQPTPTLPLTPWILGILAVFACSAGGTIVKLQVSQKRTSIPGSRKELFGNPVLGQGRYDRGKAPLAREKCER